MDRWVDLEFEQPELARLAQAKFDLGRHKNVATLRKSVVRLNDAGNRLLIQSWSRDRGYRRIERD